MNCMRRSYHFCLSSHDEVMFRDDDDMNYAFNCLALAAYDTETRVLADAELSTHMHFCVQTDNPLAFERKRRFPYSYYFNHKYHRRGRLGERSAYVGEVEGVRHLLAAVSYNLRQGLHHGLVSSPFEYEHCSANVIFRKQLGKRPANATMPPMHVYKHLPGKRTLPEGYRMEESGLILREDVIDWAYVEELYVTPRNFLYYMNRLSDDKWVREQADESCDAPAVTLESFERSGNGRTLSDMLANEHGHVDMSRMSDMELCRWIDRMYVPQYFDGDCGKTLYDIPLKRRLELAGKILEWFGMHQGRVSGDVVIKRITAEQLARCFALCVNQK